MRNIDFTPSWYRDAVAARSVRRRHIVWVVLLVGSLGGWAFVQDARIRSARADTRLLEGIFAQQSASVHLAMELDEQLEHARARLEVLAGLEGGANQCRLLAEISELLPATVVLDGVQITRRNRLAIETDEGAPDRGEVPRLNTTIRGHAIKGRDVGRLMKALSASGVFDEVGLTFSRPSRIGGLDVREFEIRCRLPLFQ